ncbi:MAG: histidine kinase [Ferruginibacter sp.]
MQYRFFYTVLFTSLAFISLCTAQYKEQNFICYTVKDGLSDNYITSIKQDDQGYLWIGTDAGLNRYDGNTFQNFYQQSSKFALASNGIYGLKKSGQNKLGILNRNGFQLLDTRNFSLQDLFIPDTGFIKRYSNSIWDVILMPGENCLLSTATGIYVLDRNDKLILRFDAFTPAELMNKKASYGRDILPVSENEYLIYTANETIVYYNNNTNRITEIQRSDSSWKDFFSDNKQNYQIPILRTRIYENAYLFAYLHKDSIFYYNHNSHKKVGSALPPKITWQSKIETLNDSTFLINASDYGFYIFKLNRNTGEITFYPGLNLDKHRITCMYVDADKRLWIGTTNGLLQQKLNNDFIESFKFPEIQAENLVNGYSCVYRYKAYLYLGIFSRNVGLLVLDAATMKVVRKIALFNNDNMFNEVRSIQQYHNDTLWLGTNNGIVWMDTKSFQYGKVMNNSNRPVMENLTVMLAPEGKDGYAWMCGVLEGIVARYHIASHQFTFFKRDTRPALPFTKVKNIAYDAYGDVWISGHALTRWNNKSNQFDTLIKVYGGANKYDDDIVTFTADGSGSLWLHNPFNDLVEYKIKERRFVAYTPRDGLPDGEIRSLSPVINNSLWIGYNNNYLVQFNTLTKKIKIYDQGDGLTNERPSARSLFFDSSSGFMYMPCNKYLVRFSQKGVDAPVDNNEITIQELAVNNKISWFNPSNDIKLKPHENNLALYFTVIDFETGKNYRFAYRLNPEEEWQDIGTQHSLNLTALPSGKYFIYLKATGKSGDQKFKTFRFSILPSFWETTWFIVLAGLSLLALAFVFYHYRIKQVQQKANLDKLLAQTEMKALHAQMNPHFIFNSLNSIREMILNNENNEASHFLGKFAQLIRMTLNQSGKVFITLSQTMDYLTRYMEMEQIRNGFFTCRILADDELDLNETILPPMLIQPFIENALWHGTTADNKKINVNIDFKKENNQLVCIIDDNGIGIDQSLRNKNEGIDQHTSVGIANIKNRILLLNEKYNLKCSVSTKDKNTLPGYSESGTLITLRLPIQITTNE